MKRLRRIVLRPTINGGICDFCGETANALKVFNQAPSAGMCYCRKCAPLSETDRDWILTTPPKGKDDERLRRSQIHL
jgi:hypothetical protein